MSTAPQIRSKAASEVRNVSVDMSGKLDTGEMLTGTPVLDEQTTNDLTFSNQAINTVALTINEATVPIAHAVQFKVSGGLAGRRYTIQISIGTTAQPAQTLIENIILTIT